MGVFGEANHGIFSPNKFGRELGKAKAESWQALKADQEAVKNGEMDELELLLNVQARAKKRKAIMRRAYAAYRSRGW